MDKREHGRRLKTAMAARGFNRQVIADATGVNARTVTNWTTGETLPQPIERAALVELLGDYAAGGDPVETAVRGSRLTEDRQYEVLGTYKRLLRQQDEEEGRREGA